MATTGLFTTGYAPNVETTAESDFFQHYVKFFMQMSFHDLYYNLRRNSIQMKILMKRFKGDQLEMKLISLEAPELFKELLCSNSQEAKNYREQIREYNAALSFASMGAEIKAPPAGTVYSTLKPLADKKFNAHINVEVCASEKIVKYLYKYVYEGHDEASVGFQTNDGLINNDEFLTFLDGRYVSAPEEMWRLDEFFLSEKSHVGNHEIGRSLAKPTASGKTKW
ncbi:hypothetical protein AVEN_263514-1 [Araneus ventricosus]|uniref:Uncharacterized protein n=1 Tax=Araneus ventricosus TaxID=182803 RepID=A0A4Y2EWY4_ARAVE|nr:hypothetical protein AVEN_263514-1 [Araneus ventricosus]